MQKSSHALLYYADVIVFLVGVNCDAGKCPVIVTKCYLYSIVIATAKYYKPVLVTSCP